MDASSEEEKLHVELQHGLFLMHFSYHLKCQKRQKIQSFFTQPLNSSTFKLKSEKNK